MYDLVIRNGLLVDGTASPGRLADIAVDGDRITLVGPVHDRGREEIDASDLVVAPGFIDVHSHDDLVVLDRPQMEFKVLQGVTTVVIGNCGWAVVPPSPESERVVESGLFGPKMETDWGDFGSYFAHIDSAGPSCNVAALVGHGAVRQAVLGMNPRAPNQAELRRMAALVAEGMDAGALGLSTGLVYEPGSYATTQEIIALGRPVAEAGGIYVSHIRNEADQLVEAVEEALDVGRALGCGVHISHHKALGLQNWGKVGASIATIDRARERGLDVTADAYPYTATSTLLQATTRTGIIEREVAERIVVASFRAWEGVVGKSIARLSDEWALPFDQVVARLLEVDEGTLVIRHLLAEADVRAVLGHEVTMIGSDGLPSYTGKPHPRLYGTFPRVLARYVREERLLTLEEAVRRMTSLPARKFGLACRGEVRPGYQADLVCFNPLKVVDRATFDEPRRYPEGIRHVIVNGRLVMRDGRHLETKAGRFLRRGRSEG